MMKKILLLFLAITSFTSFSQNTYVPDDNFEQALIDLGYDTGTLDDYVPTANINGITELDISSKNILDLTGIEDFTTLENFTCSNNPFESVDLSNNKQLKLFWCSSNSLKNVNVKNGNNTNLIFYTVGSSNLVCVKVDDVAYAIANWKDKNYVDSNTLFSLECGNTYVPDDNFEKALITLGYDNYPLDDYVPTVKIESVTSINLSAKGIKDLKGIEGFTALKSLYLVNNVLTSLDVSANVNLETLQFYNNQVTSLDLSENVALKSLRADNNRLTQLNIKNGNNTNITNQNFNASRNPDLTCIEVDNANYASSTWFSKDAVATYSENCHFNDTYIPDDNFEQALINLGYDSGALDDYVPTANINAITSLDVSSKNIADATGIEAFVGLTSLDISNNKLTNLDVSANAVLVNLQVNSNQLERLNFKNGVNNSIASANFNALNNTNLTCIEVDNATFSTTNWTQIDASTSFSENCHYGQTYVPDDNFEQWLIYTGYDTGVIDDYVPTANINTITTLSFYNKKIVDLTGIEAFAALETLSLVNNKIVTADLSKNLTLISLDISQNELTSLDLSKNTALTSVNLSINKLTSLNFQNGANVNISAANFKTSGNPDLACINVDDVAYANTNFTQKDAHTSFSLKCGFTYVPDDNFEQALINLGYDAGALDNYVPDATIKTLTSLDVSGQNIADFTGLEDFVALTSLNCSNNNLSNLNLDANILLEDLNCSDNQLTSLEITKNMALQTLNANNNQLTDVDISKNTGLTSLNIDANKLTSLDITKNNLVTTISCNNNEIASLSMVNDNTILANLDASNNKLSAIDVSVLEGLSNLNLESNLITNLDISNNENLTVFNASNNQLTFLNVKNGANTAISTANFIVLNNPNLTCILVDDVTYTTANWTNIDGVASFSLDCGLAYFPDSKFENVLIKLGYDSGTPDKYVPIANINTVTSLDLRGKFITDPTGIEYFTALEALDCSFNFFTSLDLSASLALTTLNCADNRLTNLNITKNVALTSVNCLDNNLSSLDVSNNIALTSLVCTNNRIKNLDLSQQKDLTNLYCSNNRELESLILPINAPITYISCSNNKLTSLDVSTNTDLTNLYCSENEITSLDLSKNIVLTQFSCNDNKLTNLVLPKSVVKVDCSNNLLTSLDASEIKSMIHLRCSRNQLTSLNISNSTMIELKCSFNQLTTLDTRTTRIKELFADNNQLTSLNVKNGLNHQMFNSKFRVNDNPNLTCITVDNTEYSTNEWTAYVDRQMSFNEDCASLSIDDEFLVDAISLYPNPASEFLNIKVDNQQIKYIRIFNVFGKEVMQLSSNSGIEKINVSNLSAGIYVLNLQTDVGQFSKKIIKK